RAQSAQAGTDALAAAGHDDRADRSRQVCRAALRARRSAAGNRALPADPQALPPHLAPDHRRYQPRPRRSQPALAHALRRAPPDAACLAARAAAPAQRRAAALVRAARCSLARCAGALRLVGRTGRRDRGLLLESAHVFWGTPMPSFDVVSKLDLHELTNAIDQANRELSNRFDFKGSDAVFVRTAETIVPLKAQDQFQLKQMLEILKQLLAS